MEKIIDKISKYNIFNNLFPGVLFVIIINKIFNLNIFNYNIFIIIIISYFIGIVLSRIGSIIIEPVLFEKKISYNDYIKAEKKDSKINELLQEKNMYRTLSALIICTIICEIFKIISKKIQFNNDILILVLLIILFFLFVIASKKQNKYIVDRIKNQTK